VIDASNYVVLVIAVCSYTRHDENFLNCVSLFPCVFPRQLRAGTSIAAWRRTLCSFLGCLHCEF